MLDDIYASRHSHLGHNSRRDRHIVFCIEVLVRNRICRETISKYIISLLNRIAVAKYKRFPAIDLL